MITFGKVTKNRVFSLAPTKLIVISFFSIIIGAVLLALPLSSNDGKSVRFLDALFTATSATCVTGLVVVDTKTQWSVFGQTIILMLIQLGGLGLVTLATFFTVLIRRKIGLKGMLLAQESVNYYSIEGILTLVRKIVIVTFCIELLGAIILSIRFIPKFGVHGIYVSIFTSISAFCNAGFDIMGDFKSLTEYNNDPIVIYTVSSLIIIGGLGFLVWKDLYEFKLNKNVLLHTKIVIIMTALLIIGGSFSFYIFEHNNPLTMGNLSQFEKINSAFFHSVVTRTAGFNSLPTNEMREISKVITIILMFIGAAPGSTAGGIKVTTLGVLLIAIISQIRGNNDAVAFNRIIPHNVVSKAITITALSGMLVIVVTTVVLAIENGTFINILYEATSAFGTVGLSTGITPTLSSLSKLLIIITMFLGRVGPLSFAIALTLRTNKNVSGIIYPEAKIIVG